MSSSSSAGGGSSPDSSDDDRQATAATTAEDGGVAANDRPPSGSASPASSDTSKEAPPDNNDDSDAEQQGQKSPQAVVAERSDEDQTKQGDSSDDEQPEAQRHTFPPVAGDNSSGDEQNETTVVQQSSPTVPSSANDETGEKEQTPTPGGDDGDDGAEANVDTAALFGDDADMSSSSGGEETEQRKNSEKVIEQPTREDLDDIVGPRLRFDDDDDGDDAGPTEAIINVDAPKISVDLGREGAYFVKFPNFLSVEPRPFDEDHYEDEIDEDEQLDEEGRSRLKLKVENTIRWRYGVDEYGNEKKESNAKIVKWSDGTMSLYLGSEIFDVHKQPVQDHNHLFVRQGAGLQGQSVFKKKLIFRPHSTDTLTHRKMTLSMADRSNKTQKVKVLASVGADPEAQKQELMKREEERLRASAKRDAHQRRIRERSFGTRSLTANYLEPDRDDDSDEGESVNALKRAYKPGGKEYERRFGAPKAASGDESNDSDSDDAQKEKLEKAKRAIESSDSDDSDKQSVEKKADKPTIQDDDEDSA